MRRTNGDVLPPYSARQKKVLVDGVVYLFDAERSAGGLRLEEHTVGKGEWGTLIRTLYMRGLPRSCWKLWTSSWSNLYGGSALLRHMCAPSVHKVDHDMHDGERRGRGPEKKSSRGIETSLDRKSVV